jgi:uncharacterized membrane protein (UPF0182 family)
MPMGADNIEDFSKKLREVRVKDLRAKFKSGFTKPRIAILVILLLVVIFFIIIAPLAGFYTEALWYNHTGFQNLFWKTIMAKVLMVVIFGALFFILLYGNIFLARKIPPPQQIETEGSPLDEFVTRTRKVWKKVIGWGLLAICIFAAIVAGVGWAGKWDLLLKFLNHSAFGKTDPVFHKDIGYYVFSYPFLRAFNDWLFGALIFVLIVTAIVYVLDGGIRLKWGRDMFAPYVWAHLSILLAALFLVKAWSYRLNMYELLFSKRGVVYGIGYTDAHAKLPALWLMLAVAIIAAVIFLVNIWRRGWVLPAIAVGSLVVVAVVFGTVVPALVQSYVVKPSERAKEKQYIAREINATRDAYDINKVQSTAYPAVQDLDLSAIERNSATIRNIRLWDPRPLLDTNQQLQSIRQYYKFNDIGVDRYIVDGTLRQMMISAREMVQAQLPAAARTWVNNTLVYTHGYGVVMNPSNDVTDEGNPNYVVKDLPPTGPTNLQVTRPEIYFGQLSNDYVVTDTTEPEFNYPAKDKEVRTVYTGNGGVKVHSFWRKLLFSIRFRDINLLLSGQVQNKSQIMYVRNIKDRLAKCAPFLKFDRDPYMVLAEDGKLYWISDGYTTTDKYPYSQPSDFGNYVRNSVKAVVDAYNGTVKLYVFDARDPVIQTYQKIFPQIFAPLSQMPVTLLKHVRYPEDLFVAQSNILRTFHMTNPDQFYNKEDEWDFPNETVDGQPAPMTPFYVILRIPGEAREEMVLLLPFTPHGKQNMIAWLGARMDPLHYGELVNFVFPSGKLVYGPEQIEGRIDQDPTISAQLSLWKQAGSEVIRGNLLVIPIEGSLIYVEPLYLQATALKIPQVKRVVVVYNQQVSMKPTLDEAIAGIFAGAPPTPEAATPQAPSQPAQPTDLGKQALDLYNKALDAQKAGDWASYGNYLNQLNDILKKLAGQ